MLNDSAAAPPSVRFQVNSYLLFQNRDQSAALQRVLLRVLGGLHSHRTLLLAPTFKYPLPFELRLPFLKSLHASGAPVVTMIQ